MSRVLYRLFHAGGVLPMEFSWPVFAVMLLLGAVQLAVGVVLGRCLPLRTAGGTPPRRRRPVAELDPRRLQFFAGRLAKLVTGVCGEVGDHRNQISEVSRELASVRGDDAGTLTDAVLRSIARIVAINERLQGRLESAEQRLQQQNEQLEAHFNESRTDPLTGLMNRRAFDDALRFQAEQGSRPFALMMVDVDHFKALNDRHGHPAGDEALCGVSRRLEGLLAGTGMVARYGGEEFAVLVPAIGTVEAQQVAERLRLAVAAAPFACEQHRLPLTVSLGAALVAQHDDPGAAFKRSDEALYSAKGAGRNCAFFHDGQRCRRIELDVSELPATSGIVDGAPADWAGKPLPDGLATEESFDEISVHLRQRMAEVTAT